jgi:hypothetical protein
MARLAWYYYWILLAHTFRQCQCKYHVTSYHYLFRDRDPIATYRDFSLSFWPEPFNGRLAILAMELAPATNAISSQSSAVLSRPQPPFATLPSVPPAEVWSSTANAVDPPQVARRRPGVREWPTSQNESNASMVLVTSKQSSGKYGWTLKSPGLVSYDLCLLPRLVAQSFQIDTREKHPAALSSENAVEGTGFKSKAGSISNLGKKDR